MTRLIQVCTTTNTRGNAAAIARAAVEQRLAACAQIAGPITSTYWWKGKIETRREWVCMFRTRRTKFTALAAAIKARHPYETPEIIAVDIAAGSPDYLAWIAFETRTRKKHGANVRTQVPPPRRRR